MGFPPTLHSRKDLSCKHLRFGWQIAYLATEKFQEPHASGSLCLVSGYKEQGVSANRCLGRRRKDKGRGPGVHSPLVGTHSSRRPPNRPEVSPDRPRALMPSPGRRRGGPDGSHPQRGSPPVGVAKTP